MPTVLWKKTGDENELDVMLYRLLCPQSIKTESSFESEIISAEAKLNLMDFTYMLCHA